MHYIYGTNPPRSGLSFDVWCASEDRFEWALHRKYVGKFRAVRSRMARYLKTWRNIMFAQWIEKLLAEARVIIENPNSTDRQREVAQKVIDTHGGGNV